jgi:hypothetical protein
MKIGLSITTLLNIYGSGSVIFSAAGHVTKVGGN